MIRGIRTIRTRRSCSQKHKIQNCGNSMPSHTIETIRRWVHGRQLDYKRQAVRVGELLDWVNTLINC